MKKTYIAPSLVCVKMEAMQMLAASPNMRIDMNDTTDQAFSDKKDWSEQFWGEQIWDE